VSGTDTGAGKDAASTGDELDVVVGHAADARDALSVQQQRLALRHSLEDFERDDERRHHSGPSAIQYLSAHEQGHVVRVQHAGCL
jgi:hypothetical protein